MAWTQSDLDALDAAIAKGEHVVTFADRSVTYRTVDELLKARAVIVGALAAAAGRPKQFLGTASKGFSRE